MRAASVQGLRSGLSAFLSPDDLNARAQRLNPDTTPDPYTQTLNTPLQDAQAQYAGPAWGQFFGAVQKKQEDVQDAGGNFRVNWRGFGR